MCRIAWEYEAVLAERQTSVSPKLEIFGVQTSLTLVDDYIS